MEHTSSPSAQSNTQSCPESSKPACCSSISPCGTIDRRQFVKLASAGSAALTGVTGLQPVMAGPFVTADFETMIPADKKLNVEWIQALYDRGIPTIYRGRELETIGMPVGGICCGQLYISGDGTLWYWDIFASQTTTDYSSVTVGPHYAKPLEPISTIEQGFAISTTVDRHTTIRRLDKTGFHDIEFEGRYPIAAIRYRDTDSPVTVELEAFSPFIPLEPIESAIPATILQFTVRNTSAQTVDVELAGWLQNAVCRYDDYEWVGVRHNRIQRRNGATMLSCWAEPNPQQSRTVRPDIAFDDFEDEEYNGWTAVGTAFGSGPIRVKAMPEYQGDVGAHGEGTVNTHNTRQGEDVEGGDAHLGKLTSRPFVIERNYITFLIGGGSHKDKTCLNLMVNGTAVLSATGKNNNHMQQQIFDVQQWLGQEAYFEIVDDVNGPWGNIGVDRIIFTDEPKTDTNFENLKGNGSMGLALLPPAGRPFSNASIQLQHGTIGAFPSLSGKSTKHATHPFGTPLVGSVGSRFKLKPGKSKTLTFALTWFFPDYRNPHGEMATIQGLETKRRHYTNRFSSALDVAAYLARNFERLASQTKLWVKTWYDSSLPYWFLDRTFATIDCLATQTCHWFDDGRFWAWEGVDCCPGTCQHVWQYAQTMARIFPQIERDTRERIDYGLAYHENGQLDYRGEFHIGQVATDGQAGTILRVYREHTMSPDDAFLRRIWPRVKKSIEYIIEQDGNENGLLEGQQFNTLDAAWYGPMGWISSLYLASVCAGAAMAQEMGDTAFAHRCLTIVERGRTNLVDQLFDGEYFIHKPDPNHPEATNTNAGCHIDQMFGQSYAWQLGLDRVVPKEQAVSALKALWKYNYTPDIGPYRTGMKPYINSGRWYAMPGEGGLLMCTWPKGGADKAPGKGNPVFVGYFNECMTGFEYQVAAHMMWEGLDREALAVVRTIHDRYHASKRNPWNEVECSDHYSRAMMSYGVYLAACGFHYHGPKGYLSFAPRLSPERFRAAFTTAEGWGTFAQQRSSGTQTETLELKYGMLKLKELVFEIPEGARIKTVSGDASIQKLFQIDRSVHIELKEPAVLRAGDTLAFELLW